MGEQGVTIGLREIYDTVLEVATGVRTLNDRVGRLEANAQKADEIEDVSRNALQKAEDSQEKINTLISHITRLWRTIVGAIIVSGAGYVIVHWHLTGLIYLASVTGATSFSTPAGSRSSELRMWLYITWFITKSVFVI